jgi:hypothetical protein
MIFKIGHDNGNLFDSDMDTIAAFNPKVTGKSENGCNWDVEVDISTIEELIALKKALHESLLIKGNTEDGTLKLQLFSIWDYCNG